MFPSCRHNTGCRACRPKCTKSRFGFAGELPTTFRSEDGFDFGTGDAATDRAMVWRRDTSAPLPDELTATYRR